MAVSNSISLYNCQAVDIEQIPLVDIEKFRNFIIDAVVSGMRIASYFAFPCGDRRFRLFAVLADDDSGNLRLLSSEVSDKYPSLTPDCTQAHLFEREIAEQWSIVPEGHVWLKPVRFHASYCTEKNAGDFLGENLAGPSVMDFFKVTGEQVHEVAVGPVHAGIIEPGHFRFQCHGEHVLNLEISLGY